MIFAVIASGIWAIVNACVGAISAVIMLPRRAWTVVRVVLVSAKRDLCVPLTAQRCEKFSILGGLIFG